MVKYIVGSPGRSGSIFVALTIAQSLGIRPVMSNYEALANSTAPVVYHSHDAQLQLDSSIPMLHIVRNDLFAEIVSALISEQYNEWFEYSGNQQPFVADLETFENKYTWHKHWHSAHRALTNYTNRQTLVFEEFVGRSEVVCQKLGIRTVQVHTNKSPYSQANIINIDELCQRFEELESQSVPETWDASQWKDQRAV